MTKPKKKLHQKKKKPVVFSGSTVSTSGEEITPREKRLREQVAVLGVMAKAMIAQLERQDRETWEIIKRDENEPMVPGSAVWHVHQR